MSNVMESLAHGVVQRVTFRSQLTPDYTYDPWAPVPEQPPGGGAGWLMDLVKPAVTIETAGGPVEIAPYGTPTENYGALAAGAGIATIVGAIVLIGWIARRF